ncbi:MAG: hypothetical protein MJY72_02525 [Bacteroidales bacterium]|nr:hypothetical protein [Bacteroidales bacterium]
MKKLFAAISILIICSASSFAQSSGGMQDDFNRVEIEAGLAGITYLNTFILFGISDIAHSGSSAVEKYGADGHERAPEFIVPAALCVGARYNILKWLSVGGEVQLQHLQSKNYHTQTDSQSGESVKSYAGLHSMTTFALMPELRFTFHRWEKVNLYADLEAGVDVVNMECEKDQKPQCRFAFNVTPIGIQFGADRLFGLAELGLGSEWIGIKAGIGYRF